MNASQSNALKNDSSLGLFVYFARFERIQLKGCAFALSPILFLFGQRIAFNSPSLTLSPPASCTLPPSTRCGTFLCLDCSNGLSHFGQTLFLLSYPIGQCVCFWVVSVVKGSEVEVGLLSLSMHKLKTSFWPFGCC